MAEEFVRYHAKSIFKSKSLWVNLLTIVASLLDKSTGANLIPLNGETQVMVLGLINVLLRYYTVRPVALVDDKVIQVPKQ